MHLQTVKPLVGLNMYDKVAYEECISKQLNLLVGLNMCDKVAY